MLRGTVFYRDHIMKEGGIVAFPIVFGKYSAVGECLAYRLGGSSNNLRGSLLVLERTTWMTVLEKKDRVR